MITLDIGTEFIGKAHDAWVHQHGVKLVFNRTRKPVDNTSIESIKSRLRNECLTLNIKWITSLDHAQKIIGQWNEDYNDIFPYSLYC